MIAQAKSMSATERQQMHVQYDISYESAFYAHYFPVTKTTKEEFQAQIELAKTINPLDGKTVEHWMTTSFVSNFDGKTITKQQRPTLQLVIVRKKTQTNINSNKQA